MVSAGPEAIGRRRRIAAVGDGDTLGVRVHRAGRRGDSRWACANRRPACTVCRRRRFRATPSRRRLLGMLKTTPMSRPPLDDEARARGPARPPANQIRERASGAASGNRRRCRRAGPSIKVLAETGPALAAAQTLIEDLALGGAPLPHRISGTRGLHEPRDRVQSVCIWSLHGLAIMLCRHLAKLSCSYCSKSPNLAIFLLSKP